MEAGTTAPAMSPAQRRAVAVGGCLAVAAVVFCGYVLLNWPTPHPLRTTTRDDAVAAVQRDADSFAGLVIGVARSGPLTDDRLSTYALQRPDPIGTAQVTTQGRSSVVTFPVRRPYDGSSAGHEVTACYRFMLTGGGTAVQPGELREVPAAQCAQDRGRASG